MAALAVISGKRTNIFRVDSNGAPKCIWLEDGDQQQGSLVWLKSGQGFLTTQEGNVTANVIYCLKDVTKHSIVSLPSGPLLLRVTGDGRTLIVAQHIVAPGSIRCYDLNILLGGDSEQPVAVEDHNHSVLALTASTVTTHIAVSTLSGIVRLFDSGSGAPLKSWELRGGGPTPKGCLAFSQKNAVEPLRLAAGADDGQVFVWDLSPVASGPVVVNKQLRRIAGIGFGAYRKESVLLSSSDLGQICVTNMQNYPNVQSNDILSVDLKVGVSCMAIRDDGQLLAIGTTDGRVGIIGVEILVNEKNPRDFKVVDVGTGLSVTDIAFKRSRQAKDHSRENRTSAAAAAAVPVGAALGPSAAQRVPLEDTTNGLGGAKRRLLLDKQDANAARVALASTARPASPAISQRQQPVTAATGPAATTQLLATPGGPAAAAATSSSNCAAASRPADQPSMLRPLGSLEPQAIQRPAVPRLAIPGITQTVGQHWRPSSMGGVDNTGSSSTTPTGPERMAEEAVGAGGQVLTSPVAQAAAAAVPCGRSPVPSPLRPPGGSGSIDLTSSAAGLRSYLDEFRLEVRELARGLAVDMVRHAIDAEKVHKNGIALLQLENRVLQEEVESLRQGLAENLRFGLLGRQGAPWQ